ncbi:ADP-ribose pyrophosphatase [Aeropyrum camini SY1 = JCM 12091]|uniref:ADP-ribose pyrophosphatase n=1 Tax=Aeropyrum camini SY1 = JCM 12091 TaxID=1198449 RepID=U3TD98_9CREN|nr:ADP-ribose pyrophosphatase [Aeropyrum camini SY1 = JCM 12091]
MNVECRGRRVRFEARIETLPNGRQILVDRVMFPDSVAVLPLVEKDGEWRVILVRQFRPSIGKWTLEAPAGTLKEGETPEAAAARELEEEAGLKAKALVRVGGGHVSPGYSTEYIHLFLAYSLDKGEMSPEEHEVIEGVVDMTLSEALKAIETGVIEDLKTIALVTIAALRVQGLEAGGGVQHG